MNRMANRTARAFSEPTAERNDARVASIRRLGRVLASAMVTAPLCLLGAASAVAQGSPELTNANIAVDYYEPRNPEFVPYYETLQRRRVLEELGQFLAPVKWPHKLRLVMKECPAVGTPTPEVFYNPIEYSLIVCYQWFKFLNTFHPPETVGTRQEVIVGALVGTVLHEAGRAVFDMLNVPRLGSDEDAADEIASFIGLQFGPQVARTVIKGTYYLWDTYDYYTRTQNRQYNFASRSSVAPQRAYNTLCIAYGADPVTFKDFVDKGLLDRVLSGSRAAGCADEYRQVAKAFERTIEPHVDLKLMDKVHGMKWIMPDDLK